MPPTVESWSAWPAPADRLSPRGTFFPRHRTELNHQEALPAARTPSAHASPVPSRSARCHLPGKPLRARLVLLSSAPFNWAFYRLSLGLDLAVSCLSVLSQEGLMAASQLSVCLQRQTVGSGGWVLGSTARWGFSFSSKIDSTPQPPDPVPSAPSPRRCWDVGESSCLLASTRALALHTQGRREGTSGLSSCYRGGMAELGGRPETVFRVPAACQPEGTATPEEAGLSPGRGDPPTL